MYTKQKKPKYPFLKPPMSLPSLRPFEGPL